MKLSDKYKIKQSSSRHPNMANYWQWEIWIDASDRDLHNIEKVVYILHPTFKNRVREINSVKSSFKLKSASWGEFTILIRIYLKIDEQPLYMAHDLKLFSTKKMNSKKIFISSQIKHQAWTEELTKKLESLNYEVSSPATIPSGSNFSQSIIDSIESSDIYLLIGSDINPSQQFEISKAKELGKQTIVLSDEAKEMQNLQDTILVKTKQELLDFL